MKTTDLIKLAKLEALSKLKDKTSKAKYSLIKITAGLLVSLQNASAKKKEALSHAGLLRIFWKEAEISTIRDFLAHYSDKKVSLLSLVKNAAASEFSKKKEEEFDKQTDELIYSILSTIINENYRDFITYFDHPKLKECINGINEEYIAKLIFPDTTKTLPKWTLTLQEQGINQEAIIAATPAIKDLLLSVISNNSELERFIYNSTVITNPLLSKHILHLINTTETKQVLKKHINPDMLLSLYNNTQPLSKLVDDLFTDNSQITQERLKYVLQYIQEITHLTIDNLEAIINIVDQLNFDQDIISQLQKEHILQNILKIIKDNKLLEKISVINDDTILFIASTKFIQNKLTEMLGVNNEQLHDIIKLSMPDIKLILKMLATDQNLRSLIIELIVDYSKTGKMNNNIISKIFIQFTSAQNKEICADLKFDFIPLFLTSTTKKFDLPVPEKDIKHILLDTIHAVQDDSLKQYFDRIFSYDFQENSPQELLKTSTEFQKEILMLATQPQIITLLAGKYSHIILAELLKDKNTELLANYLQIEDKQASTEIITHATVATLQLAQQPYFHNMLYNIRQMVMTYDVEQNIETNLKNNESELKTILCQTIASNDFRQTVEHLKSSQELNSILENEHVKEFACSKMNIDKDTYNLLVQNGYTQLDSISKLFTNEIIQKNISNIYQNYTPDMSVIDMILCKKIRSSIIDILKQDDFYDFLYNSSKDLISSIASISDMDMKQAGQDNYAANNTDEIKTVIDLLKDILQKTDKEKSDKTMSFLPTTLKQLQNKDLNFVQKICIIVKICSFCIKEFGVKKTISILKVGVKSSKIKKTVSNFLKTKSNEVSTNLKKIGHKKNSKILSK